MVWRSYPVEPAEAVEPAGAGWSARIPLADLVAGAGLAGRSVLVGEVGAGWRVAFSDGDAQARDLPVSVDFTGSRQTVGDVEAVARPADDEALWLRVLPLGPVVCAVELVDGVLSFTGDLPGGQPNGTTCGSCCASGAALIRTRCSRRTSSCRRRCPPAGGYGSRSPARAGCRTATGWCSTGGTATRLRLTCPLILPPGGCCLGMSQWLGGGWNCCPIGSGKPSG